MKYGGRRKNLNNKILEQRPAFEKVLNK